MGNVRGSNAAEGFETHRAFDNKPGCCLLLTDAAAVQFRRKQTYSAVDACCPRERKFFKAASTGGLILVGMN